MKIMRVKRSLERSSEVSWCHHSMVEVGRDFWRFSGPTPLLKQDHLELIAHENVLNISRNGYSTTVVQIESMNREVLVQENSNIFLRNALYIIWITSV